jgi:hypothetical protein
MGLRSFVRSLGSECRIVILRPNAGWHERKPFAVTRDLFAAIHISSLGVSRQLDKQFDERQPAARAFPTQGVALYTISADPN